MAIFKKEQTIIWPLEYDFYHRYLLSRVIPINCDYFCLPSENEKMAYRLIGNYHGRKSHHYFSVKILAENLKKMAVFWLLGYPLFGCLYPCDCLPFPFFAQSYSDQMKYSNLIELRGPLSSDLFLICSSGNFTAKWDCLRIESESGHISFSSHIS